MSRHYLVYCVCDLQTPSEPVVLVEFGISLQGSVAECKQPKDIMPRNTALTARIPGVLTCK